MPALSHLSGPAPKRALRPSFIAAMDGAEKVRVLVCGDGGVGKNRLIKKFISVGGIKASTLSTIGNNPLTQSQRFVIFTDYYSGVDVQSKTIRVGDKDVKLQIW